MIFAYAMLLEQYRKKGQLGAGHYVGHMMTSFKLVCWSTSLASQRSGFVSSSFTTAQVPLTLKLFLSFAVQMKFYELRRMTY